MISAAQKLENKGLRRGLERGLQRGLQRGLLKGRQEGELKGRQEEKQETARKLLAEGLPIELVIRTTSLSLAQVKALL